MPFDVCSDIKFAPGGQPACAVALKIELICAEDSRTGSTGRARRTRPEDITAAAQADHFAIKRTPTIANKEHDGHGSVHIEIHPSKRT